METETKPTTRRADFYVEIEFERDSRDPSRVFRAMSDLIEAFERLDQTLVQSIDARLEPILLLEDIERGSLRAWLAQVIRELDDDAVKELSVKKLIGSYLVRGKHIIADFIEKRATVTDRSEIDALENRLLEAAKETDVLSFPSYAPVNTRQLLQRMEEISEALTVLQPGDSVVFSRGSEEDRRTFNLDFRISAESIADMLTREIITSRVVMIAKVKKPDYLGESQWDFRHESRSFSARIEDQEWLRQFQSRNVDVRPGDGLRARVRTEVHYGHDGEVLATHYAVEEVLEVVPLSARLPERRLFDDQDRESDEPPPPRHPDR